MIINVCVTMGDQTMSTLEICEFSTIVHVDKKLTLIRSLKRHLLKEAELSTWFSCASAINPGMLSMIMEVNSSYTLLCSVINLVLDASHQSLIKTP